MEEEVFYVKSFEEDFVLKTIKNNKKVNFQSIKDILKTKTIKPNTKSFGRKMRLSTTIIHKNYLKTYRPQGIIFQTNQKPDYVMPFDLVLLSASNKIIVHYYRIKNNLHVFYNRTLIPGFEDFVFKDFKSLIKKFNSHKKVWKSVNKFRVKNGYKNLPEQKYRLVTYNEAVFNKQVKIKPIAIFGYRKNSRELAKFSGLPHYISVKEFYKKYKNE